ncbi:MAG TPA: hypothetical protein HA261_08240 [Methanosarcina sp.]|nr:hypothetical protein [Methanosarcina sp.]
MLDCAEVLLKAMFSGLGKANDRSPTSASPAASITAAVQLVFSFYGELKAVLWHFPE